MAEPNESGSEVLFRAARTNVKVIVVKTDTMRYDHGHKYLMTGSLTFNLLKCIIAANTYDLPGREQWNTLNKARQDDLWIKAFLRTVCGFSI